MLLTVAVKLLIRSSPYLAQAGDLGCAYGRAAAIGKPSWMRLVEECADEWERRAKLREAKNANALRFSAFFVYVL